MVFVWKSCFNCVESKDRGQEVHPSLENPLEKSLVLKVTQQHLLGIFQISAQHFLQVLDESGIATGSGHFKVNVHAPEVKVGRSHHSQDVVDEHHLLVEEAFLVGE